jgi:hypothetical protein
MLGLLQRNVYSSIISKKSFGSLFYATKMRNSNGKKKREKMLMISNSKGNADQNHTKIPLHPC